MALSEQTLSLAASWSGCSSSGPVSLSFPTWALDKIPYVITDANESFLLNGFAVGISFAISNQACTRDVALKSSTQE